MGKHPDLLKKYFWDGEGAALGTLKNECAEEMSAHIAHWVSEEHKDKSAAERAALIKKILQDELEAEPFGEFSYDTLVVCGSKNYALRRKMLAHPEIDDLENLTLKGIRKNAKIHRFCEPQEYKQALSTKTAVPWQEIPNGGEALQFKHYELLARGGAIQQHQEQF
jgi:hypothetical protein